MDELRVKELISRGHWRRLAACLSADPELFFPISATGLSLVQAEAAKAVCADCPVRGQCLIFAIFTGQRYGIWGGFTEEERTAAFGLSAAGPGKRHTDDSR